MDRAPSKLRGGMPYFALASLSAAAFAAAHAEEAAPVDLASPFAQQLLSCMALDEDAARLACFDRAAAPLAAAERAAEGSAVKLLQGEGDLDSKSFEMTGPWRVAWVSKGSILTIELRSGLGEVHDVVGNQIGAGEGASEVLDPGVWQLAIRGIGAWQVRVVPEAVE